MQTQSMDHHGLVAGVCKELKIAERLDHLLEPDPSRKVSPGRAVVAMILNGLGFTNRRMYLTHQFFENKPVERLLDAPLLAKDMTDYTLGHALDDIARYGVSSLFARVSFDIALAHNLLGKLNHIDTTSLSVHGAYEGQEETSAIELTHGFSKDHRPDLKQAVLSLTLNGPSDFPLWIEPLNGNSSDKESFHETIKKVEAFKQQIELEKGFKWVADSALYTKDRLLKNNDYLWLTRVPETIRAARKWVEKPDEEIAWQVHEEGYKSASFASDYGDIAQRWLLVHSMQAQKREQKTFEKHLSRQTEGLKKELWHLGNEVFSCEKDAQGMLKPLIKKYPFHLISSTVMPIKKHAQRGKPKAGEEPVTVGYRIEATFSNKEEAINKMLSSKGRFILATNDLDESAYTNVMMLQEYKEQQSVERGFRFLKDPWFMVDSIFLKRPKRIEALMMVMALCLMVYNVAQYKLREALKKQDETLPNQLGKAVKNPTMRWVFQLMEGIGIVKFFEEDVLVPTKEWITNLNRVRKKIILLLGKYTAQMYGLEAEWLIFESNINGLGM